MLKSNYCDVDFLWMFMQSMYKHMMKMTLFVMKPVWRSQARYWALIQRALDFSADALFHYDFKNAGFQMSLQRAMEKLNICQI